MITIKDIPYYALLEQCTAENRKTPRYMVVKAHGDYKPIKKFTNIRTKTKGKTFFYLTRNMKAKKNEPTVAIHSTKGFNISGLFQYFEDKELSGFAYGYPFQEEETKGGKENPFFPNHIHDGFLFIIPYNDLKNGSPKRIEIIVVAGQCTFIGDICKQLSIGGMSDIVESLRKSAEAV